MTAVVKLPNESQRHLKPMTPFELGWLAGFLEGEGCFSKGTKRSRQKVRVYASSTDRDVLEYVLALTGLGRLSRPHSPGVLGKKPISQWRANGSEAAQLMRVLLPHMHKRRARKIRQELRDYDRYMATALAKRSVRILEQKTRRIIVVCDVKAFCREKKLAPNKLYNTLINKTKRWHNGYARIS